jgi:hypothetical protein
MAEGWHFEQMPPGHGGCEPEEQGTATLKSSSSKGGKYDTLAAEGLFACVSSFRKYEWKDMCLMR